MHSSFSFDLETNIYFTPNNFKAYATALEAPPVPKIRALFSFKGKKSASALANP